MDISLTSTQFRRLLDLVYIGNWILNSYRGEDAIVPFLEVQSILLKKASQEGMSVLCQEDSGHFYPSDAFVQGGIHAPISQYEDISFYHLLAEELALRDLENDISNYPLFLRLLDSYFAEFEAFGVQRLVVDEEIGE